MNMNNITPIKDETKNKFDALLRQALNSKVRKNVENIAVQKPRSDIDSLASSIENLKMRSSLSQNEQREVVQVDVHEASGHDTNFILNKFLNDSSNIKDDEIMTIDVNEPDMLFIKPPVPKPRKNRKPALVLNSSSGTSSVGTYKIASPVVVRDISGNNNKPETLKNGNNVIDSIDNTKITTGHNSSPSSCNSQSSIAEKSVQELNIKEAVVNNEDSESTDKISEVAKDDTSKIRYENEVKHRLKRKHTSKNLEENRSTFKDVVETVIEDRKKPKYTYEKIIAVIIHKTDQLKLDSLVIHPVAKIHIVNSETGEYLKKSDPNRPVVFFYENKDVTYITSVISEPYNLYEKRSLYPAWEETLILNEDINILLCKENNCLIFFEIMDFVSFSVANSQSNQTGASRGWHKIAWAFLKPVGKNGELNIERKVRLQLYYPNKHKKTPPNECPIFYWWHKKKLLKYPASLFVTVKAIIPPEKIVETLRSKTPIQGEKGSKTHFSADIELNQYQNPLIKHTPTNELGKNQDGKDIVWSRLSYQSCKLPNKCVAELASYEEGCLVLKFSNNGLYLACAVLIDDVYAIIIFSVKSYEEICKYSGHQGLIYSINWSKDDQVIVTASADCTVCIWSFAQRNFVGMLPHPSYVYTSEISSKNAVATGCYDNIIRIWTNKLGATYDLIQEIEGHKGYITSLCFNNKSTQLYSSDSVGVVIEWKKEKDTWNLKRELKLADLRDTIINQILLHTRERRLLIHARDSTLRIIDLKTGCVLHWLQGSINNRFNTKCSFSACGNYVFVGGENGLINVWNADTGESIATYAPYDTFHYQNLTIHCIHFHPHDNILAISHYGHGLPILLTIYDNTVHGKSNIGLQLLQHDDEIQMHKNDPLSTAINMKSIANKIVTNSNEKKQGKIKFEDVIEKIDQIIVKRSAIGNNSRSSLDNLVS